MSRRTRAAQLRHHAELTPAGSGQVLVTVSVGPDDQAVTLWSSATGRDSLRSRTTQPGGSFPDPAPPSPVAAEIVTYAPQRSGVVRLTNLDLAHCHVQPLPKERFLIAAARCRWRPEGPDRNAMIVNTDGGTVRTGILGDGIEHLLTTPAGKIWVGYFDEGICGNYGWGLTGAGPEPVGAPGLIRFNTGLEPEWQFPTDNDLDPIGDCYALNVTGETAWTTYYTAFPVVRVDGSGTTRSWKGAGTAAHALLVDGTRCALIGGYRPHHNRVLVGNLDRAHFKPYRLTLPNGRPLPRNARVIGRGPSLHVFHHTAWYRLDLEDLP